MSLTDSASYVHGGPSLESDDDRDDVDSLPSSTDSASPESEDESDAERQWHESLQQLELLLTMVLVPYLGKYFGRKCAYWGEWHSHLMQPCGCPPSGPPRLIRRLQAGPSGWNGAILSKSCTPTKGPSRLLEPSKQPHHCEQ